MHVIVCICVCEFQDEIILRGEECKNLGKKLKNSGKKKGQNSDFSICTS